ncbi:DNA-directed RNA polymerase sigma-70 factor [Fulvitalea axinellae]|uniref:DNA-directed RNA polymerase sigma-70 factor n=1 Tax=Fulvitalea axinellae TaxID=1182444 RepID=A0AAU9CL64_9BACT|nr:DNA-directed RNA polymerase sigma-70 factor [Fulvitalea axinellae]
MLTLDDFESFKKGDRRAFKKVFEAFHKSLVLFARKYSDETGVAEDCVQEVFVKIWETRKRIKDFQTFKGLLYVSVRNRALNMSRSAKVADSHAYEFFRERYAESYFKNHLIEEETSRLLLQAIENMPAQTREVCQMSMRGVKNAEIAERMDISVNTVKYHKKKASEMLRESMEDQYYLLALLFLGL